MKTFDKYCSPNNNSSRILLTLKTIDICNIFVKTQKYKYLPVNIHIGTYIISTHMEILSDFLTVWKIISML